MRQRTQSKTATITSFVPTVVLILVSALSGPLTAQSTINSFGDDFSSETADWKPLFEKGEWTVENGIFTSAGQGVTTARLAPTPAIYDAIINVQFKLGNSKRTNVGVVLRAQDDRSCLVIRYYDVNRNLEMLHFDNGSLKDRQSGTAALSLRRNTWYTLKVVAIQDTIMARLWPASQTEPLRWHLSTPTSRTSPGQPGLFADDNSIVSFRNFTAAWDEKDIAAFKDDLAKEKQKRIQRMKESLQMTVEATPFVLRTDDGPQRLLTIKTTVDGSSEPVAGAVTVTSGQMRATHAIGIEDFKNGKAQVTVGEHNKPVDMKVTFATSIGKTLRTEMLLKPVRQWTFYMTPHTHFDVGFTHPQPTVIKQLSDDMELAVKYCKKTADWPDESRYRWVVEVTGLMKNYIDRHSKKQVDEFMKLVRAGQIEICAYYLNMPTELVGHEELIRCLYYAEHLRRTWDIEIDTAMLNDVPGYTWALPELFVESGINRVSFRANSIHARFLWYRQNAAKRPFYWQGPEGSRVFFWYTDSYREGNFFRSPGLHEGSFLSIIRRNEAAGCTVDDIQLRMGGDNLPPDLGASRNARAWNEKYVWPKVVVATNREFLEILEQKYGPKCRTFTGDIPSWWAEGPASSAQETGANRLTHDKLVAAEALWTQLCLSDPATEYPRQTINRAYDNMFYFDEHTWGASSSVRKPQSEQTRIQWRWKADYSRKAKELTDNLYDEALTKLSKSLPRTSPHDVLIWNTLAWPRTDVVTLDMKTAPLTGTKSISVTDTRSNRQVPVQISADGSKAYFIASNIPPMGYARYLIKPSATPHADESQSKRSISSNTIENKYYRIRYAKDTQTISSWYDKDLNRELIDTESLYRANQAIYETPLQIDINDGRRGRNIIERKSPVQFKRIAARDTVILSHQTGPVFTEITTSSTLPTCPHILQKVRLYHDLKIVDITNTITKEEVFTPEGVYFAFPFAVEAPEFQVQIANAVMRPGIDQLPLSCFDFYSIQHWAHVQGPDYGITIAPLDAPLVTLSDINTYKWADTIEFDKGHIYSLVMNNYWYTNFKGGQKGDLTFRYRLTSRKGRHDPARATRFAWQPFYPLQPVWLQSRITSQAPASQSFVDLSNDSVVVSCIKTAETGDDIIVRLLEQSRKPSKCTLTLRLPHGKIIKHAYLANAVERPLEELTVKSGNSVPVKLRPNEIVTLRIIISN